MADRPLLPAADLRGLNLVVGLSATGLSAVRVLSTLGAEVAVVDSRPNPPGLSRLRERYPHVSCALGGFPEAAFSRAARMIVSPGVPLETPAIAAARRRGVPAWGDVELFARLTRVESPRIAAITGSNGKSTVTSLLGEMARLSGHSSAVGGNLGIPALDLLDLRGSLPAPAELYVLELSSFQLEATESLQPAVAALLNLSPDHMDRYRGFADYVAAKQRVFAGCEHAVVNADDAEAVAAFAASRAAGRARLTSFTLAELDPADDPVVVAGGRRLYGDRFGLLTVDGEPHLAHRPAAGGAPAAWFPAARISPALPGRHNVANALAALALGHALGLPRDVMLAALALFRGLAHRCEPVAEGDGVRWIDDSKGTNVGATVAALQGLPGPLLLIAGGEGKGQDFSPLTEALRRHVKTLILIGRDADAIAAVAPPQLHCVRAADMPDAVRQAARLARAGDTVLLSPACASFDMFDNYEQRGQAFSDAVRRLLAAGASA